MKTEETERIREILWTLWHKTYDIQAEVFRLRSDIDKVFQLLTVLEAD